MWDGDVSHGQCGRLLCLSVSVVFRAANDPSRKLVFHNHGEGRPLIEPYPG